MPVYENDESTQIRVAVSVGGKLRQKYFHPKTPAALESDRKKASLLQQEWKFEATIIASDKKKQRKETARAKGSAYVTGVSGIKMKFVVDTKNRPVKGAKTRKKRKIRYYTPSFVVSGSHNNKGFCKAFNIKALGFKIAWYKAVEYLCTTQQISSMDKLFKKIPPIEQFAVIYNWQCQQGHTIPRERFPDELLKQSMEGDMGSYLNG